MIADPTLLLPLAVLWPMLLAGLALLPGWGSRMVLLLPLAVLLDEVFCAKTAVPERRDSPKVATIIFFM